MTEPLKIMSSSGGQVKILHQVMVLQGGTIGIVCTFYVFEIIHHHLVKFLLVVALYNSVVRILACSLISNKSDGDPIELILLLIDGVEVFTAL